MSVLTPVELWWSQCWPEWSPLSQLSVSLVWEPEILISMIYREIEKNGSLRRDYFGLPKYILILRIEATHNSIHWILNKVKAQAQMIFRVIPEVHQTFFSKEPCCHQQMLLWLPWDNCSQPLNSTTGWTSWHREDLSEYFHLHCPHPYMTLTPGHT